MVGDDDVSEGHLTALTSESGSHLETNGAYESGGLKDGSRVRLNPAGWGGSRRSGTPEPWIRKLADDGMSYYYWNKATGQIEWSLPAAEVSPAPLPEVAD